MAVLNERNEKNKGVIHLLVTTICNRKCKYCCNNQYDLNSIPYVTDDELREAHTLCITGGEPFLFSNPSSIALHYKRLFQNIENVYVYTNAMELVYFASNAHNFLGIDGLNISIKTKADAVVFDRCIKDNDDIKNKPSNILYVFDDLYDKTEIEGFKVIQREWQKDFKPAEDSIFRKI